jgi:hypothetical protein
MALRPEETLPPSDDPGLEGGEWLFRRDGQVFGPVDSRGIAAMLYRGEVDGKTPVSTGDGAWSPLAEVPIFLVHSRKAEVGLRVEREVTGERLLRARRRRWGVIVAVVAAVVLVGGAGVAAFLLARRARETSALLEDFGAGIRIASAARVGVSQRTSTDEVEVPMDAPPQPGSGAARSKRTPAPGPAAPRGTVAEDDLVAAHFDGGKIQAVVAREQRTLVPCFRAEAARSPDFTGDVPLEFAIGNDGRVATRWIDEPRFREGSLKECVKGALAAWRFDPFPGQRPTVSLAFRIGR